MLPRGGIHRPDATPESESFKSCNPEDGKMKKDAETGQVEGPVTTRVTTQPNIPVESPSDMMDKQFQELEDRVVRSEDERIVFRSSTAKRSIRESSR